MSIRVLSPYIFTYKTYRKELMKQRSRTPCSRNFVEEFNLCKMGHSVAAFSPSLTLKSNSRYSRRSQTLSRYICPVMNAPSMTNSCQSTSRRAFLALIASCAALQTRRPAESAPVYDAMKTRRYVDSGRPPPDRKPPTFVDGRPVFPIDTLQAQDLTVGKGDAVKKGTSYNFV